MIDLSWSWTLLGFAASFYFSWVVFALVWFLVLYCHGNSNGEFLYGKLKKFFPFLDKNTFYFYIEILSNRNIFHPTSIVVFL